MKTLTWTQSLAICLAIAVAYGVFATWKFTEQVNRNRALSNALQSVMRAQYEGIK